MNMKTFLTDKNCKKTFSEKSPKLKRLINEALNIINSMGIPIEDKTPRGMEKMAVAFMAVAQVNKSNGWSKAKDRNDGIALKSRDVIDYMNSKLEEKMSSGSYDDIRRKDLKLMVLDGLVSRSLPDSKRNDPTRGYCLSPEYAEVIRAFGTDDWNNKLSYLLRNKITLRDVLSKKRDLRKIRVTLPSGEKLAFSPGEHHDLQKKIIEQFLPIYGYGAEILYVGDTADKFLFVNREALESLSFFDLSHGELPDIIAYSKSKNWLYIIEAVHSSGPISPTRHLELEQLTKNCKADRIYVTAFLDRATFRKFVADISWETEVWIAEDPEHLIHFDGDKFLGPYDSSIAKK